MPSGSRFFRIFLLRIAEMPRRRKQATLVVMDCLFIIFLLWFGYSVRFGEFFVPRPWQAVLILAAPVVALPIFIRLGLYRSILRYLPDRAIWTILEAVTLAVLAWVAVIFLSMVKGAGSVPRTIPIIYWAGTVCFLVFSRFGMKWLLSGEGKVGLQPRRTLIYGASEAGAQLLIALRSAKARQVMGFVSDDPALQGMDMMGLRVYPPDAVEALVSNMGIEEIIVTTGFPSAADRRDLLARFSSLPVKLRTVPLVSDAANGRDVTNFVRSFGIDDLLARSEVPANPALLKAAVEGKVVMVTGAAGSIGSAVSRLVVGFSPAALVIVDVNEHGVYEINRELGQLSNAPVIAALGSVTDPIFINRVLRENVVDTVFHCAAYKHVALVEENVFQGVRNNVFGTATLVEASHRRGVTNFVLISSDKAVRPASVMGATKRWAELIVRHYGLAVADEGRRRCYSCVRFGNVIGSSGSVVPLFREQIANGGPVTITHQNMTRYFMSVREAAELIVQASVLSENGDILLLEMGQAVNIRELAENMIVLAGLTVREEANPSGDIEIVTIGPRPGEKMFEELFYDRMGVTATDHPKILRAKRLEHFGDIVPDGLGRLKAALDAGDEQSVRTILFDPMEAAPDAALPRRAGGI